jgi:hypothetical protein
VRGDDKDEMANCWAINVDIGNMCMKHHAYRDGVYTSHEPGVAKSTFMGKWPKYGKNTLAGQTYHMRLEVNRRLDGADALKWVTAKVTQKVEGADTVLAHFEVDYNKCSYQPDMTKTVRLGLNTCAADWTAWNLKAAYLDKVKTKEPAPIKKQN